MSNQKKLVRKSKPQGRQLTRNLYAGLAGVYCFLFAVFFPFYVTDKYSYILHDKYYFFVYVTMAFCAACAVVFLAGRPSVRSLSESGKKADRASLAFLAFLVIVSLSTLFSRWRYEAFWGNMGRFQGMFFYLFLVFCFLFLSQKSEIPEKGLSLLFLAGVVLSVWGILDFLGVDPLGWRAAYGNYQKMLDFTASIGNVNTYTALIALYLGTAAWLLVSRKGGFLLSAAVFLFFTALITGASDNAVLSVGGVFMLLPLLTCRKRNGLFRFLLLTALFFAALCFSGILLHFWKITPVLPEKKWGVFLAVSHAMPLVFGILSAALIVLVLFLEKKYRDIPDAEIGWFRKVWTGLLIAGAAGLFLLLYLANSGKFPEMPAFLQNIFVFNDSWGTGRGYVWRAGFELFGEAPFYEKLIGSGPETFALRMKEARYYEMKELFGYIFDSPHSEPLQMLFTTGILGFVSYYTGIILALRDGFRKEGAGACLSFGACAYLFASLVNISVPITTPLFIMFLAVAKAGLKNEKKMV